MASVTSSLTSTAAPPLTTVFTQPTDCTSIFTLVNTTSDLLYENGLVTSWADLLADTADPRFSTCQPPGWDANDFTFSPAVCPSGWAYYTIWQTSRYVSKTEQYYTRAYCCESGFEHHYYDSDTGFPTQRCVSSTTTTVTPSTSATSIRRLDEPDVTVSHFFHQAIAVQWHKSETKDLPYSLPNVPQYAVIHTWIPDTEVIGSDVGSGSGSDVGSGSDTSSGGYSGMVVIIVLCTVFGFFFLIGLLCCMKGSMESPIAEDAPPREGAELRQRRRAK